MSKTPLIDMAKSVNTHDEQILQTKRVIDHMTSDFENAKREIEITNRQIELHQASAKKSIEAIDHTLKVGRVVEGIGMIFIVLSVVLIFLGKASLSVTASLIACIFTWGGVGYQAYMQHKDDKRQAEVDRQIEELEKQKEGD